MFYFIDLLLETELETVNWREECHLVTVTPSVEQEPNSYRHIHSQGDKKWSAYYTHYYFRPQLYHLILWQTIRETFTAIGIRIYLQFNIMYIGPSPRLNPYMIHVGQIWSPNNVLHIYVLHYFRLLHPEIWNLWQTCPATCLFIFGKPI